MLYFIISLIALALISVTMLVRANDISFKKGFTWQVRKLSFIVVGFAPVGIALRELSTDCQPSIYEVLFRCGLAGVFMTTPYLPPWWKWISDYAKDAHPLDAVREMEHTLWSALVAQWRRFIAWLCRRPPNGPRDPGPGGGGEGGPGPVHWP